MRTWNGSGTSAFQGTAADRRPTVEQLYHPTVTHKVEHEAVTHEVEHAAVMHEVQHEAVTHIETHPAVARTVSHPEEGHYESRLMSEAYEETILVKDAWDEPIWEEWTVCNGCKQSGIRRLL